MAHDKARLYPIKKLVPLTAEMAERIRNHRFKHRIASENEAVRQLIEAGLSAAQSSSALPDDQRGKALSKLRDLVVEATAAFEGNDRHGGD